MAGGDGFGVRGQKNNSRRFNGGGVRPDRSETKRQEAQARQESWSKLSPQQQLAALDAVLGKGLGAKKQRARIMARLAGSEQKKKKGSK